MVSSPTAGAGELSSAISVENVGNKASRTLSHASKNCAAEQFATLESSAAVQRRQKGKAPAGTPPPTTQSDVRLPNEPQPSQHNWLQQVRDKYRSLEVQNTGSVARDHLALERTFLAWLRTSLAFASIGIAITQLFRLNTSSLSYPNPESNQHLRQLGKPLGMTFLSISILMLLMGFQRYFECQQWIIQGKFPASRGSIVLVATITFGLIMTSLILVLVMGPKDGILQ